MASKTRHKTGSTHRRSRRVRISERLTARVARQKKALQSIIGIGASGFTDISREHDTYLHEKP